MKAGDYCLTLRDTDESAGHIGSVKHGRYADRVCVVVAARGDDLFKETMPYDSHTYTHMLRAVDDGPPLNGPRPDCRLYHERDLQPLDANVAKLLYGVGP